MDPTKALTSRPRESDYPDWADRFLTYYRTNGNLSLSARLAGISTSAVQRAIDGWPETGLRPNPAFTASFRIAREDARNVLLAKAWELALNKENVQVLLFLLKGYFPEFSREGAPINVTAQVTLGDPDRQELLARARRLLQLPGPSDQPEEGDPSP